MKKVVFIVLLVCGVAYGGYRWFNSGADVIGIDPDNKVIKVVIQKYINNSYLMSSPPPPDEKITRTYTIYYTTYTMVESREREVRAHWEKIR